MRGLLLASLAILATPAEAIADAGSPVAFLSSRQQSDTAHPSQSQEAKTIERVEKTSKKFYYIERATLDQEVASPDSPVEGGALCLTVGGGDQLEGVALEWQQCWSSAINPHMIVDPAQVKAQHFTLEMSGQIKSRANGLCIRQMSCDGRTVYDLGDCEELEYMTTWEVKKVLASNLAHLKPMGYPVQAVALDYCQLCGPYILLDQCTGKSNRPFSCDRNYQARPGWTKQPSQYVHDDPQDRIEKIESAGERISKQIHRSANLPDNDKSSIGPTDGAYATCGSLTNEMPAFTGFFYFLEEKDSDRV